MNKPGGDSQSRDFPSTKRKGPAAGSWLARWGVAGVLSCVVIACVAILAFQNIQLNQLARTVRTLLPVAQAAASSTQSSPTVPADTPHAPPRTAAEEMAQLNERVEQMNAEIAQLDRVRSENDRIRAQLAMPISVTNTATDQAALQAAKERALKIACINNLKQLGLAARIWAGDNGDIYPPDILSMTNEMNTPKILVCPADGRQPAADWASYTAANCSYEYLAPSANLQEPNRVMFRCAIHGNYGLCDGSVQTLSSDTASKALVQRDGKLYLEFNNR